MDSFNSIVVRLKEFFENRIAQAQEPFQFHSGSIKRLLDVLGEIDVMEFQFHSGSIKSLPLGFVGKRSQGFNSIVVRLKGVSSAMLSECE